MLIFMKLLVNTWIIQYIKLLMKIQKFGRVKILVVVALLTLSNFLPYAPSKSAIRMTETIVKTEEEGFTNILINSIAQEQ